MKTTDKDGYIKRMEDAVVKANVAMTKLRQENSQLRQHITLLEEKIAKLENTRKRELVKPSFPDKSTPQLTKKMARLRHSRANNLD